MEVQPFTEQFLGATMDFAARAAKIFPYSWAGREDLFRWKYLDQPVKLAGQDVPCWIAVKDGRVVGFLGSMASGFWYAGAEMPGVAAMDLYLEDACRGQGVGKEMLRLYEESARLKLMLVSSAQAHSIYLHRGYHDLPGIGARASIWGLRGAVHWLARRLRLQRFHLEPPQPAGRLTDWLLKQPGIAVLDEAHRDSLDTFLSDAQRRFSLAPRRTVDYLLWKYRNHPDRHGEVFTLTHGGSLRAVFALVNRKLGGPPMLVIGDVFLADHDDTDTVREITALTRRLLGVTGAHAAAAFGCWAPLDAALQHALASRAQSFRCSLLVDDCDTAPDTATAYISAGDGDYLR